MMNAPHHSSGFVEEALCWSEGGRQLALSHSTTWRSAKVIFFEELVRDCDGSLCEKRPLSFGVLKGIGHPLAPENTDSRCQKPDQ